MNPANATVSTNSAQGVAVRAFLETTLLSLVVSTVVIIIPVLLASLQPCAAIPAPGAPQPVCHVPWVSLGALAVTSFLTGGMNALTAFLGKTHQIATTPQAIVAQTLPADGDHQDRPQTITGTVVSAASLAAPVAPIEHPAPAADAVPAPATS